MDTNTLVREKEFKTLKEIEEVLLYILLNFVISGNDMTEWRVVLIWPRSVRRFSDFTLSKFFSFYF